jgi:hypothetical protein
MRRHEFFLPFARLYTRCSDDDALDSIRFRSSESFGDEEIPALTAPDTWSAEAVAVMAEAAHCSVPADLRANEENTVPSWLWRHQNRSTRRVAEADLRDIFNRAVGSAAAKAWKLGFFTAEKHARAFYDEARYALMQRHIAIAPAVLANWGLSWAYGIEEAPRRASTETGTQSQLSNAAIDAMLGKAKDPASAGLWKKMFTVKGNAPVAVPLRLCDISADWHSYTPNPARAAVDVMALRNEEGGVHIDALKQTVRILMILLDLQERQDVTIGIANIAPLLMASGLAYDSDAGRAMAASVAALVSAECIATSAELAGLRGMSEPFKESHGAVMRLLRNHRRAVYGDDNDYEKLSVLPAPLPLKNCPDLALAAEAQRRWDDAVEFAKTLGLRATQATDLTPSRVLAVLMTSASQGLEPMQRLIDWKCNESGETSPVLHEAVSSAFRRMKYAPAVASVTKQHIMGSGTLRKASGVSAAALKAKGLDDVALEKIEAYLPCVNSVRLAVTPWVVGVENCAALLKIPAKTFEAPGFDLLERLGFTDDQVVAANLCCYGHGTARNAKSLPLGHRPVFACGEEISNEARIRMAAAVQSFISGDTGITVRLAPQQSVERGAEMALTAWRTGLKSLIIVFDPAVIAKPLATHSARRIAAAHEPLGKAVATVQRRSVKKNAPVLATKKVAGARRGAR